MATYTSSVLKLSSFTSSVGSTAIRRLLPQTRCQSVGPFVFLDHFGPFMAKETTIGAHPHAGIDVITYLIDGANEHRDSAGHQGIVTSGGAQWMRAGRGAIHAEKVLPQLAPVVHGVQVWARLPVADEDSEPRYRAFQQHEIPEVSLGAGSVRVVAGSLLDARGPMELPGQALLAHLRLDSKGHLGALELDQGWQWGVYCLTGELRIELSSGKLADLTFGELLVCGEHTATPVAVQVAPDSIRGATALVLAGPPIRDELVFGGPFVYSRMESLRAAERRFTSGEMGSLDGIPS